MVEYDVRKFTVRDGMGRARVVTMRKLGPGRVEFTGGCPEPLKFARFLKARKSAKARTARMLAKARQRGLPI